MLSEPTARFTCPGEPEHLFKPSDQPLSTQGRTTGPSEYLTNSAPDFEDRDRPSEPAQNHYGVLRCQLTDLQDQVNEHLTKQMQAEKGKQN